MGKEVSIIKASTTLDKRKGNAIGVDRKRVAAYCRVSTSKEDQLNSYHSQVAYYKELISKNPEWENVGIYSDEGISGTGAEKRVGFRNMIKDCMNNKIDTVITKSISRFARNTLDTLKYVRLLKEKNIEVFFEDENIKTLSMDGELLLVILSSVAQQEVENISANVKKGLAMKMTRGELIGFNGAYGYNYDSETKSISINEVEAKVVRRIFDEYINGNGSRVIARELMEEGILSPGKAKVWQQSTVLGIIKNEKYVGDLLQGKTFTVDPISHRRLDNYGEADKYYIKDHHEAIIEREVWDAAQKLLQARGKTKRNPRINPDEYRTIYSRAYTLSGLCKCGYCGATLTRKSIRRKNESKVVWHCTNYVKHGKKSCDKSKYIRESEIEEAFLESYQLMVKNKKEILDELFNRITEEFNEYKHQQSLEQYKTKIENLSLKKDRLLDLLLNQSIDKETYDNKLERLNAQITGAQKQLSQFENLKNFKDEKEKRLKEIKNLLEKAEPIKEMNRQVFEAIVDYVVVGGYDNNMNASPYQITFIYKTGEKHTKKGDRGRTKKESQILSDDEKNGKQLNEHATCGVCTLVLWSYFYLADLI